MMESGTVATLEPDLRRILAPNPSPMTYHGTNTYMLGEGAIVLIDPGPDIPAHADTVLSSLGPGERIELILVTHAHLDHAPLARRLSAGTGAPVLAAGPADWGRSPIMQRLARSGAVGGGEGIDHDFAPDRQIADGDRIPGPWGEIEVLATPGHMANHLSFAWRGALFTGDLVMGWSTSLVSPPDGDMTDFMSSLKRLSERSDRIYYPGHGEPVPQPRARCAELIAHRRHREAQIRSALATMGPASAQELAATIYTDLDRALLPAAARNVLAHLIDMEQKKEILFEGAIAADSRVERL